MGTSAEAVAAYFTATKRGRLRGLAVEGRGRLAPGCAVDPGDQRVGKSDPAVAINPHGAQYMLAVLHPKLACEE